MKAVLQICGHSATYLLVLGLFSFRKMQFPHVHVDVKGILRHLPPYSFNYVVKGCIHLLALVFFLQLPTSLCACLG